MKKMGRIAAVLLLLLLLGWGVEARGGAEYGPGGTTAAGNRPGTTEAENGAGGVSEAENGAGGMVEAENGAGGMAEAENNPGSSGTEDGDIPGDASGRADALAGGTEGVQQITTEYEDADSYSMEEMDAMHNAVQTILACGTGDFFLGYPVDESFLCWVGGSFGQEVLGRLADALKKGSVRPKLWYEQTGRSMHVLWLEYCREHKYATYWLEHTVWKEAADSSDLTIDFIGDINFDDRWYTMQAAAAKGGVDACISPKVQKELKGADLTVVNNEFTYTDRGKALKDKAYTFRAARESVEYLKVFGTDLAVLANNHTFDYGETGLLDTLDVLDEAGIPHCGAGRNLQEASAVQYFVIGGRKIAIVCASEIERYYTFTRQAGENKPGIFKTQQEALLLDVIARTKANSDYVIAYIHWGAEGSVVADSGQMTLARTYAEAGADAVIGGHPHRLQGLTFVEQVPVAYSLGNFWFSTGTLYTTIAQIHIGAGGKLRLRLLPCLQKDGETDLLEDADQVKEFYHYLADISHNIGIDEDGYLFSFPDVDAPGESPYAYTSGRRYGMRVGDEDLEGRAIDIIGNLVTVQP